MLLTFDIKCPWEISIIRKIGSVSTICWIILLKNQSGALKIYQVNWNWLSNGTKNTGTIQIIHCFAAQQSLWSCRICKNVDWHWIESWFLRPKNLSFQMFRGKQGIKFQPLYLILQKSLSEKILHCWKQALVSMFWLLHCVYRCGKHVRSIYIIRGQIL